eukprot:GHVN01066487.1.p1 GENE.GHVN01066487.1~~GHVN01066487.1.p1  ORF type:complete len:909 (+),score=60.73 GHVN01066487.1:3760-6486(+)
MVHQRRTDSAGSSPIGGEKGGGLGALVHKPHKKGNKLIRELRDSLNLKGISRSEKPSGSAQSSPRGLENRAGPGVTPRSGPRPSHDSLESDAVTDELNAPPELGTSDPVPTETVSASFVAQGKRGLMYKQSSSNLVSSWNLRFFALDGSVLKYYSSEKTLKPTCTYPLNKCVMEGLFSPESNVAMNGGPYWTFTMRWPSDAAELSYDLSLGDEGIKFLHLGLEKESEADCWFQAIKAIVNSCSFPPNPLDFPEFMLPVPHLSKALMGLARIGGSRPGEREVTDDNAIRSPMSGGSLLLTPRATATTNETNRNRAGDSPSSSRTRPVAKPPAGQEPKFDFRQMPKPMRSIGCQVMADLHHSNRNWILDNVEDGVLAFRHCDDVFRWKCETRLPVSQSIVMTTLLDPWMLNEWPPQSVKASWHRHSMWNVDMVLTTRETCGDHCTFTNRLFADENSTILDPLVTGVNVDMLYRLRRAGWRGESDAMYLCCSSREPSPSELSQSQIPFPVWALGRLLSWISPPKHIGERPREQMGRRKSSDSTSSSSKYDASEIQIPVPARSLPTNLAYAGWKVTADGDQPDMWSTLSFTCRFNPSQPGWRPWPMVPELFLNLFSRNVTIRTVAMGLMSHVTHLRMFLTAGLLSDFGSDRISQVVQFCSIAPDPQPNPSTVELSSDQKEAVEQLSRRFRSFGRTWSDIARFLDANFWKVPAAERQLAHEVKWRREYRIDSLDAQHVRDEIANGWARIVGGMSTVLQSPQPVILIRLNKLRVRAMRRDSSASCNDNTDEIEHYCVYLVSRIISKINQESFASKKALSKGGKQTPSQFEENHLISVVVDASQCTFNNTPLSIAFKMLEVLTAFYPCKLGQLVVCQPTLQLVLAYKTLRLFIPPSTLSKIHFTSVAAVQRSGAI